MNIKTFITFSKYYSLLITILFCQSCAYVVNHGTQEIHFKSADNLYNVNMIVNGINTGSLPQTVELSRCEDHNIIFEKNNYQTQHLNIIRKQHAGLILFSAITSLGLGIVADEHKCALNSLGNTDISVYLKPDIKY